MLGCVILFPLLAHIVNQRVRGGAESPLHCVDCVAGVVIRGLRGAGNPTLWGLENFGFGPYVRFGGPTYGFVHEFRTWF